MRQTARGVGVCPATVSKATRRAEAVGLDWAQVDELSDEELEMVAPALESYMVEVEKLRDLDLSSVMSGRILSAEEGGNL